MRRRLGFTLIAAVLIAAPVGAQTKAKAENVPDIPIRRSPISSSCRRSCTSAKASGSPRTPRATSSSTREAATRACSSSIRTAPTSRDRRGSVGFDFAHAVRVDPQDNIWAVDEGTNMVIKFNPEGRVLMVIGRRPEPVAGRVRQHVPAGAARVYGSNGRPTSPGIRRAIFSSPTATATRES